MKLFSGAHPFGRTLQRAITGLLIPTLLVTQMTGCARKTLHDEAKEWFDQIGTKIPAAEKEAIKTGGLTAIPPGKLTNHTPVSAYQEFLKAFKQRTGEDWEKAASQFHSPKQELQYLLKEVSFAPPEGEQQVLAGLEQLANRVPEETRQKVLSIREALKQVTGTLTGLQAEAAGYRDRYLPVAAEIDRLCTDVEKLKTITDPAAVRSAVETTLNHFVNSEAPKKLNEFLETNVKTNVQKLIPEIKGGLAKLKTVWQEIEKLKKTGLKAPELDKAQEFLEDLDAKMMQTAQAMSMMAMSAKFMAESLIALGIAPHVAVFIIVVLAILALFQNGSGGGGGKGKGSGRGKGTSHNGQAPSGGKGVEPEGNPKLSDSKAKEGMLGSARPGSENEAGKRNQGSLPQGKNFVSQIKMESFPNGITAIPYSDGSTFGFLLKQEGMKEVDLNLDPKAPTGPGANSARVSRAISDCISGIRNLKMVSAHAQVQGESHIELEGVDGDRPVWVIKKPGAPFADVSAVKPGP